jgi:hypothetical protein
VQVLAGIHLGGREYVGRHGYRWKGGYRRLERDGGHLSPQVRDFGVRKNVRNVWRHGYPASGCLGFRGR